MKSRWVRFEEKFVPEPNTGCFLWFGAADERGYGRFGYGNGNKLKGAHRFAWEHAHGAIPNGVSVLHRCDNPCCVNVDHLFLGTQLDNMRDMAQKGRRAPGHLLGMRKLTNGAVCEIKKQLAAGIPQADIARAFGVDASSISNIARGATWLHVKGGSNENRR